MLPSDPTSFGSPLSEAENVAQPVVLPDLPYRPRDPSDYRPGIGLIGCGGITKHHLRAYRAAGYRVVALCDRVESRAANRRDEYFPDARVFDDYEALLKLDDVEVVDIATHPPQRPQIIEYALRAGRHVLSQKPFVTDLDVGQRLIEVADQHDVRLAVNQNGRWAPHFSYIRTAVSAGLLGDLCGVHCAVHWDHGRAIEGSAFESVKHLILYDYAIHWFDFLHCLTPSQSPRRVYASARRASSQTVPPSLLGQVAIEFDTTQATLVFDGSTPVGSLDTTVVAGSDGLLTSSGPDANAQQLVWRSAKGEATPRLEGRWFPDGFHGTMGELLSAIADNREPSNSARDNLGSLSLCFAAVASAEREEPIVPGSVRQLPA